MKEGLHACMYGGQWYAHKRLQQCMHFSQKNLLEQLITVKGITSSPNPPSLELTVMADFRFVEFTNIKASGESGENLLSFVLDRESEGQKPLKGKIVKPKLTHITLTDMAHTHTVSAYTCPYVQQMPRGKALNLNSYLKLSETNKLPLSQWQEAQ